MVEPNMQGYAFMPQYFRLKLGKGSFCKTNFWGQFNDYAPNFEFVPKLTYAMAPMAPVITTALCFI